MTEKQKAAAEAPAAQKHHGLKAYRRFFVLGIFGCLAVAGFFISVMLGSVKIPLEEIWQALCGANGGIHEQIIMNIRLPRTIVAALVGVNLALSGAILQAIMKNPLADPHIIGISSGAGLTGILVMLVFVGALWGAIVFPVIVSFYWNRVTNRAFTTSVISAVCLFTLVRFYAHARTHFSTQSEK